MVFLVYVIVSDVLLNSVHKLTYSMALVLKRRKNSKSSLSLSCNKLFSEEQNTSLPHRESNPGRRLERPESQPLDHIMGIWEHYTT